jgi:hypothetical protein
MLYFAVLYFLGLVGRWLRVILLCCAAFCLGSH